MFQPGGVTANSQGYAYGAAQPVSSGMGLLAQMQLLKGFSGSGSSSYGSSSVNGVSIIKCDDHFGKDWCFTHLVKPGTGGKFTADEIKKNPPLAIKFKDCDIIIPIPSQKAMCETGKVLIEQYLTPPVFAAASPDVRKDAAKAISKALLHDYVEECNYDDQVLSQMCLDKGAAVPKTFPPTSRRDDEHAWNQANPNPAAGTDYTTAGRNIAANFKDKVQRFR